MFEIHRTQNGDTMLIFQMDDGHLLNTISLKLRNMIACRAVLNADLPQLDPMLQYALPKQLNNEAIREKAAAEYKRLHKSLAPYIVVAVLRGLESGIKAELNQAYNNNGGRIPRLDLPGLKPATELEDHGTVQDIDDCFF